MDNDFYKVMLGFAFGLFFGNRFTVAWYRHRTNKEEGR
jgi:lipid-A-disaccharide synthase-like uncharacterized protein